MLWFRLEALRFGHHPPQRRRLLNFHFDSIRYEILATNIRQTDDAAEAANGALQESRTIIENSDKARGAAGVGKWAGLVAGCDML